MSIIKSFSVCDNNGEPRDMFYIQHKTSNFSIIRIIIKNQKCAKNANSDLYFIKNL